MDRTERLYKIDQMIGERKLVTFAELQEALEVSPATLKRDIQYLRDRLNCPLIWDREARGYRFEDAAAHPGSQFELPGLWFNATEIHALLTMQHLMSNLDKGGLLSPHIQPLMARLNGLLGTADNTADEVRKRVRIIGAAARRMHLSNFETVGSALLRRKRLMIAAESPDAEHPVYLPDSAKSFLAALKHFELPVIAIETEDAKRLADGFTVA